MTIWLLAVVLIASVAGMGYRQGVIRASFSLFGILLGALLANPLGKLIKPLLMAVGLKNPTLVWILAPIIIFIVISTIFKVVALTVHQKVDVHYKYHAGDLRLTLWERLSHRLGLCVGLINGSLYFILVCWGIYAFSYWTVQMAASDEDATSVRLLNRLGKDLNSTGFAKVAASIDKLPVSYYDAADLVGILYSNPLSEARLTRYPALLALAERQEIQDIATDQYFTEMRQKNEPIMNVVNYAKVQAVLKNPELVHEIWATLEPNLKDLPNFLETGNSPKFDGEKILGRWDFDVNSAINAVRRAKPNIASQEMQKIRKWMVAAFSKTVLIAAPDHQAILKNVPRLLSASGPATETQTLQGTWKSVDSKYQVSFPGNPKDSNISVDNDRLSISGDGMDLVFSRQN